MKIDLTSKRVLRLTLHKKAFEVMVTGEKFLEYRKMSKWIKSRLFDKNGKVRKYDYVLFINGYGADKPFFIANFKGVGQVGRDRSFKYSNGLIVDVKMRDYFISLGNILEIGNYENTRHTGIPKNGSHTTKNNTDERKSHQNK